MTKHFILFSFIFSLICLSCGSDDDSSSYQDRGLYVVSKTPNVWQYVSDPEMKSRDGSTTGYMASINPNSDRLIIYLEGGGACFNAETCTNNRSSFNQTNAIQYLNQLNANSFGLINRANSSNFFHDWSYIFVPYSTGDVHIGQNTDADVVGGPQDQQMVGYNNFTEVVKDVLNFYGRNGLTDILVTGSSAGGFGTYLNFKQVADQFPGSHLTALIDAAPIFVTEENFSPCLSTAWQNLFEFELPSDYNSVVQNSYGQPLQGIYEYLSLKYPNASFGLYSNLEDQVIRYFYGFGQNDCSGGEIPGPEFTSSLFQVKDLLDLFPNWSVYYATGTGHTTLGLADYNSLEVNGTRFSEWLEQLVNSSANNVTP